MKSLCINCVCFVYGKIKSKKIVRKKKKKTQNTYIEHVHRQQKSTLKIHQKYSVDFKYIQLGMILAQHVKK